MILDKRTLLQNVAPAKCHTKVFSEYELNTLFDLAFKYGGARYNRYGNVFIQGQSVKEAYELIKKKLSISGEFLGGNFFITTSPYGIHTDSFKEIDFIDDKNNTVYRNVVIPLWIGKHKDNYRNSAGKMVLFNQRLIDYSADFVKGYKGDYNKTGSQYKGYTDYSDLQFYHNNGKEIKKEKNLKPFDQNFYDNYLYHLDYERLEGLTIENVFDWIPGSIIELDAIQVHCSSLNKRKEFKDDYNYLKSLTWNNKMGLLIKFKTEVINGN